MSGINSAAGSVTVNPGDIEIGKVKLMGSDGVTIVDASTVGADAGSNTANTLIASVRNYGFNALTSVWDRVRVSFSRFVNYGANATLNVKASPGTVNSLYCHNLGGAAAYVQLHDTNTLPASSAVPLFSFLVPVGGTVFIDAQFWGANGHYFVNGIAFAFSTTEATYTAATAANQMTTILYS